jgi:hypothetical protein
MAGLIHRDLPRCTCHGSAQTSVGAQLVCVKDAAGIRRPPQDRVALIEPREDAVRVRPSQTLGRKIATESKQAIGLDERGVRIGEAIRRVFIEQG